MAIVIDIGKPCGDADAISQADADPPSDVSEFSVRRGFSRVRGLQPG
jgi:hypothetical protein